MPEERVPFYFIDKSLTVLCVDDDAGVRALVQNVLAPVRLFSLKTASGSREADTILSSPDRVHLCVLDMGLRDVGNDEFHLLRSFGTRVSFVVFTGATSPLKGFTIRDLGAKSIIEKSPTFDIPGFIRTLNRFSLQSIINPRYGLARDNLSLSTDVLFDKSPQTVTQWAILMGLTDRELRHIWRTKLGANAKVILSIYQIYAAAFAYYERSIKHDERRPTPTSNQKNYQRLEEYYHCHKSIIADFIAFGNIASMP